MTFNFVSTKLMLAAALVAGFGAVSAHADSITVSYLGAGVQSQTGSGYYTESFDNGFNGTTTYNGSGITGTYANPSTYTISPAGQYGGAGGTGSYIWPNFSSNGPGSYTVTLSQGVNYFGYWLSAQDPGDQLQIFNGTTLLLTFTAADLSAALGPCVANSPSNSAYCGNPNSGQTSESNFAFVNFYLSGGGTFDKLVFTELNANNGYESDNHTIANLRTAPGGTVLSTTTVPGATPEPSSLILLGTGVLGIAGGLRRRIKR